MASKKLYALAFRYKKEKLWKRLFDSEVFAARMPDGEIGYCCVMGYGGEHVALAVYVGVEGWTSYRTIADGAAAMMDYDPFEDGELPITFDRTDFQSWMFSQNCLQCALEGRDDLSAEEVEEVRQAAKEFGAPLRGANAFPHFVKYIPHRFPWHFQTREDEERMEAALSAAVSLAALLKRSSKRDLGLAPVDEETKDVLFLEREGDGWTASRTDLPEPLPASYPTPKGPDKKTLSEIRDMKRGGILECEIMNLTKPVQDDPEEAPTFPVMLLCVDSRRGNMIPVAPVTQYDTDPDSLLNAFIEAIREMGARPAAVKVRTPDTRALLEGFCAKAGILLSLDEDMPTLDEAKEHFIDMMEDDDDMDEEEMMDVMFGQIMDLSDAELSQLPEMLADHLMGMVDAGLVPLPLAQRLRRIFR